MRFFGASATSYSYYPDTKRLKEVDTRADGIWVSLAGARMNCRSLREVAGLETLSRLEQLRIARTALDPEALLARELPVDLKIVAICAGNAREDRRMRGILDARGYVEF